MKDLNTSEAGGINFEPVSIEDAAIVESPAAHAARMGNLTLNYETPPTLLS
jgi:hypothetical protein